MHFSGTRTFLLIPSLLFVVYVYTSFLYCYFLSLHLSVSYCIKIYVKITRDFEE